MMPSIFGENLFDDFFGPDFDMFPALTGRSNPLYGKHAKNLMKTDVRETEHTYELDIDLPGFKKDEVSVDLKDGYLTISAERNINKEEKDEKGKFVRRERYMGSCQRSFFVGKDVRQEDIHASFENGILKLTVPKKEIAAVEDRKYIPIK